MPLRGCCRALNYAASGSLILLPTFSAAWLYVPGIKTANSSPPKRATRSPGRLAAVVAASAILFNPVATQVSIGVVMLFEGVGIDEEQ